LTTNTGFVITDAGNAAATVATPAGPFIHITQFKVGSGYNYVPDGTETALAGSVLYTGGVSNYYVVAHDTVELILFMDATVGPFDFGEIGIYLQDGTLFAICVFDELQEKIKAVGVQGGTQWRIRARLKLADAPVICQVDVINTAAIHEVATWQLLVTPVNQVGNANMVIVHEHDPDGDPVLVYRLDDDTWALNDFAKIFTGNSADSGCTIGTSVVTHPGLTEIPFDLPRTDSKYLIKFPDGDIRRVLNTPGTGQLTFASPKAVPLTGEFQVWEYTGGECGTRWADREEYNDVVADFNVLWVTPTGTYPANNEGLNQTAIPTLSSPSRPTKAQWETFHNALITKCKIHSVPFADIIASMDYIYRCSNTNGYGLKKIKDHFDLVETTIASLITNRNVADPAYQETNTPAGGLVSRTIPWGGTKFHTITFTYADANTFKALVNGGHQITLDPTVATGANANWLGLKNFLAAIGVVTIARGGTTASGAGTGSAIGLYQLTGVYQTLFTHTDPGVAFGGAVAYTVQGKITGGNVVDIKVDVLNTGSGYYASGVSDLFTNQAAMRRPAAATLNTPVLDWPNVTSATDF
jgi:hypothetical protein